MECAVFPKIARTAMNMLLEQPAPDAHSTLEARVAEIESRLQLLAREIKRINQYLPRGSAASAGSAPQ